ncbi:MAG: NH(3)-dependent synthetase [Bacteroidetes bacterium]|nr:NH(3)-dependent synthetase [Bacteroidota bacterium]
METNQPVTQNGLDLNVAMVRELLVQFLRDESKNAGFHRGVIGVSGGVDSAVTAFLTAEALGNESTVGVIMPYRTSSAKSVEDAKTAIKQLGIRSEVVDISPMVDGYCDTWKVTDKIRRGNIMSRMRMIVLYDISARERALVIGTSNKTEIMLGYGTLFGDTASAINPIGDLYKTQVWQLARALGVPQQIIDKVPTADLWEGQSDEEELGSTYARLDALLYHLVDERRNDEELQKLGFDAGFVDRVKTLIQKNQFKRRPPLIAKVSYRTVNVDFRYARDWGL